MDKIRKFWDDYTEAMTTSKRLYLLWAFLLPMGLMALMYIAMEVWPVGNNSVLVLDLNGQYVYFFEELRQKFWNGGSLLYSWSRALGGEFLGLFAYYLASPFSLLVVLFPEEYITEALFCMFLLKCGCCGLTMASYLSRAHTGRKSVIVIFSTMYALCSYMVVQSHNTMWIDELIFLPLLLLGVERLITRRRCGLYTVALAYCLLCNFYIGYMMAILTFFYFFFWYFGHGGKDGDNNFYGERMHFLRSLLRIGLYSLIAVMIAMVILFPALISLQFGKNDFSDPNFEFVQRFDFLDAMAKLFPGSYDTVRPEGLPFLYCGTLTLIMLPFFFLCKKIRPRERIMGGMILLFFLLSFNSSTLDLIWHGFQRPNWLNYRYSFMFCFFMVLFAYRAFCELNSIRMRDVMTVCALLALLLLVIQKQHYEWLNDLHCIWFSLLAIGAYLLILWLLRSGNMAGAGTLVLATVVSLELFLSGLCDITDLDEDVRFSNRIGYRRFLSRVQPAVDALKAYEAETDGSLFYRMDKTFHRSSNDAMALGMYGFSNSTSTLNASVIKLLGQLGISARSHWSKYNGGTPVFNSLFAMKYVMYDTAYDFPFYEEIYAEVADEVFGYRNPFALSLGYAVNQAVREVDLADESYEDMPMERLNALVGAMLGLGKNAELFREIRITDTSYENLDIAFTATHKKYTPTVASGKSSISFTFTVPTEDEVFFFFPSDYRRKVTLSVNGVDAGEYYTDKSYCVTSLGVFEPGTELTLKMQLGDANLYIRSCPYYIYYLDGASYTEAMKELASSQMEISSFSDTKITGTIRVSQDRTMLFTTIPYDEGWTVRIDGKKAELVRTLDSLLAVEIEPGEHTVELVYSPFCWKLGLGCTITGLALLLALLRYDTVRRRKEAARQKAEYEAMFALAKAHRISAVGEPNLTQDGAEDTD